MEVSAVLKVKCEKICSTPLIKSIKDYRGSQGQYKMRIWDKKITKSIAMMTLRNIKYMFLAYAKPNIKKSMDSIKLESHVSDYPIGCVPDYPGRCNQEYI
jgi:hypothetical protein